MSKNFDKTVRLQSEIIQEWIRKIGGEKLKGIAEGTSSAPRLASSSTESLSGRNKCAWTYCSLIKQEEKGNSFYQICQRALGKKKDGKRKQSCEGQRGEEKTSGRLVGTAKTNKELAECRRLQQKNLNMMGLSKSREWPQCHRERSWQVPQSRLCQKKKELSRLFKSRDHEVGESQDEREPHLGEKDGDRSGSMERKQWTPQ